MNEILINASTPYRVLVGSGILCELAALVKGVTKASSIVIVSDDHVWPIYGEKVASILSAQGNFSVQSFVFPAGEQSKSASTYLSLLEYLATNHITRTDCLIALGGGVVGDLTGFAAATYLRGIDYIQIPTSLLAAVDSSVGGKTAIDLSVGKNLVGAFYQPKLVICDVDTLNTLPESIYRDGCAEVIKYAVLFDPELFDHLEAHGEAFDKAWVISRGISLKRDVVAKDEFDRGDRQKLNLGHTFGHSIEAASNFTITHGQAVAIGMAIVSHAALAYQLCNDSTAGRIISLIRKFRLPYMTNFDAHTIFENALSDKKRTGQTVQLIVPVCIGNCVIRPTPITELKDFIQAGL